MKNILLVEDDYLDVTSVKRALTKLKVEHKLMVAHNGVDALTILTTDDMGVKFIPDVIILDINMPKMTGLEFLGVIKNYYSLKNLQVFITTTSSEEYDRVTAEKLGIAGFILKPLDFEKVDKSDSGTIKLKEILLNKN